MGCAACAKRYRGTRQRARVRSSANASGQLQPSSNSTSLEGTTSGGNIADMPSTSGSLAPSVEEGAEESTS